MASQDKEKAGLLARKSYDDDADSITSKEADDPSLDGRTSQELKEQVFEDDYEESLETVPSVHKKGLGRIFQGASQTSGESGYEPVSEKKSTRPSKRHRERRKRGEEESELMYEMEEGGQASQSPSRDGTPSRGSSESDLHRLGKIQSDKRARKRRRFTHALIYLGIIGLFVLLVFAAYRATLHTWPSIALAALSNGTSTFLPTTILISLDGFRADFLQRGLTPTLNAFIQEGISPLYMLPSFPSVTFPNHYTMATGLYPESHGVVGNTFWDPALQEEFFYTDPARSMQAKWWGGEPLWATAEKAGVRTAVHMWPGSEAHIMGIEPSSMDKYNGKESLDNKVSRVLSFVDEPEATRPQLIMAYVPVVDTDGHLYGPNSTEIRQTISDVDDMLQSIFKGLTQRNLSEIVNVVVVSDHGMATTDVTRLIQLEDLVNVDEIEHIDGWPLYGLRPKNPADLNRIYTDLKVRAKDFPAIEVYLRDTDMPARYHFQHNDRIAPLWIVPKAGWAIVTRDEFDVADALASGAVYHPRGLHGYDHEHPLMRAIFVARGPAFPHKKGSRVNVFQNTELYNIVCDSIGVAPMPNNGTLRLPFKPVGLHSDPDAPKPSTPADPVPPIPPTEPTKPDLTGIPNDEGGGKKEEIGEILDSDLAEGKEGAMDSDSPDKIQPMTWWQWLAEKWKEAKEKLAELFRGASNGRQGNNSS